jgi:alanine racemase
MIDVTHIPEAQEGDSVVVFGDNPSAEELAVALGTIPYEVFTNVSQRVKRIYVEE